MSYSATRSKAPRMPDESGGRHCKAHGCPLRPVWFESNTGAPVDGLCRYHAQAPAKLWPALTEVFNSAPFERDEIEPGLFRLGMRWQEPEAWQPIPTRAPGEAYKRFQEFWANHQANRKELPGIDWAHKLRAQEWAGETLLPIQREMWRAALGHSDSDDQREAADERREIQAESGIE